MFGLSLVSLRPDTVIQVKRIENEVDGAWKDQEGEGPQVTDLILVFFPIYPCPRHPAQRFRGQLGPILELLKYDFFHCK